MKPGRIVGSLVLVIVVFVLVSSASTLTVPGRSWGLRMILSLLIPLSFFAYYRSGAIGSGVGPIMFAILMVPLWLLWVFSEERTGLGLLSLVVMLVLFPLAAVIMALWARRLLSGPVLCRC